MYFQSKLKKKIMKTQKIKCKKNTNLTLKKYQIKSMNNVNFLNQKKLSRMKSLLKIIQDNSNSQFQTYQDL